MEAEEILAKAHSQGAEEILAKARSQDELPEGWTVFPLKRQKVVAGIAGWIFGVIIGLGLFAAAAPITIPINYQHGVFSIIVTTLLLGMFLFIGLGSVYLAVIDILRLRSAEEHVIVVTPEHFVQQQGKKIMMVPLSHIRHVTARGVPPPDRDPSSEDNKVDVRTVPSITESVSGFFMGRQAVPSGQRYRKKRARTPTTLAFVDARTDKEVTVTTDTSFGDPFLIAAVIKQYATAMQH